MASSESLANELKELRVDFDVKRRNDQADPGQDPFVKEWGFGLEELYKVALKFFKEEEGTALRLTNKEKFSLAAYTKQVSHGQYNPEAVPDVGFLDVIGHDNSTDPKQQQAWQALGDMPRETAMTEFIQQLESSTMLFKPYVKAYRAEQEKLRQKKQKSEEGRKVDDEERKKRLAEEERLRQQEIERQRQHDQEMQIRAALNQQTAVQFRQYVQEQYPYNPQLQEAMIEHLQEQHYQQYMQQAYQQQVLHQQQQFEQLQKMKLEKQASGDSSSCTTAPFSITDGTDDPEDGTAPVSSYGDGSPRASLPVMPEIVPASIWTRKDIKEFKNSLHKSKENMITVSSLATATVRVPTHEDGACLFWEFATDYYDIGFGVYFEWTVSPSNKVTVHISESSDDEEEQEEEERMDSKGDDIEKGGSSSSDKVPTDEIVPVYRRDCHEDVYCGSHIYPGRGVYLLKFDNSFSLWRSKTLYYRVYYTK